MRIKNLKIYYIFRVSSIVSVVRHMYAPLDTLRVLISDLLHFQSQFNRLSRQTYVCTVGHVESLDKR